MTPLFSKIAERCFNILLPAFSSLRPGIFCTSSFLKYFYHYSYFTILILSIQVEYP